HNSNPDRGPPVGPQVGLPDRPLARDRCAPAAAANQEFSLDLKAHGARGEAAARNGNFDYDIHATLEPKCKAGGWDFRMIWQDVNPKRAHLSRSHDQSNRSAEMASFMVA